MKNFNKTCLIIAGCGMMLQACKKGDSSTNSGGATTDTTNAPIVAPTEPAIASTQGFFLNNWQAKTWVAPSTKAATKPSADGAVIVTVDVSKEITKVSSLEYGNNTNPFMGPISTVPVLINNISSLSPNILRFPGGSLSDIYFWDQSNTAPADAPAQLLDDNGTASAAGYWFGNSSSSTTMTVDDYYSALQQTKSTGLITVNYGYARYGTSANPVATAAHYAANWVRYDKGRTTYWEVGNEIYGDWEAGYRIDQTQNKDGQVQIQDGTTYGNHFKVFADSMRAAAAQVGNTNIKIGVVLDGAADQNGASEGQVSNWNNNVLTAEGNTADFFVLHNYYTPYEQNSQPSVILGTPAPGTSQMMAWVKTSVANAGVTQKPVAMDEWNIFSTGSSQMVSNIAGLHAVMTLGEALKDQISMTSRWDLANSYDNGDDMGMFNNSAPYQGAEPGAPAWNPRPAFYYMYFFQNYIGDHLLTTASSNGNISAYGSSYTSGQAGVILVNTGIGNRVVTVNFRNFAAGANYYYYTLTGGTDNAPFSHQVYVNGAGPTTSSGGPSNYATIPASTASISGGITVSIPSYSAVFLVADKK
ncbi:alpha-L-arabinofuranosidase [Mucilaginibacter sp. L196]|uniref:alpha-L-arabinofuranosidase n=1 Tax=Mucilaginibacter sp. L196 TaxID=1641870 RepID=UPI00131DADB2|nr:alpha-L-arabinofuranosidase [Mucilaginibacter sp. L196]